ncbi:MAG TPA: alpha/beta hydrolase [Microscillaceae bacterium]|nr:alpha/beta hydrolase [Microscillaceae bacterium]
MPTLLVNHCNLYYEEAGQGSETIVFAHGLLWSHKMFHKQVAHFKDRYRVIAYDHRGQGQSEVTPQAADYDMDSIYADAIGLITQLCPNQKVHFAGLSMGGFVGMRLAARRPDLLKSLILIETSAEAEPLENVPRYRTLNGIVKWLGAWAVKKPVMKIMFGQDFLQDPARQEERKFWAKQLTNNKSNITKAVQGVIDRKPVLDELAAIQIPTLIMVGDQDVATVPAKAEKIHQHIAHSKLVYIKGAGHTSSVEEPAQVNQAIDAFLAGLG